MTTTTKIWLSVCGVFLVGCLSLAWYGWSLKSELRAVRIELLRAKEDLSLLGRHVDAAGEALAEHQQSLKEARDAAKKSEYLLELVPESWGDGILPESVLGLLENGDKDAGDSAKSAR